VLDWVGEIVGLVYDVWPSYGGAFVLVALLAGLLFSPLAMRSARSRRTLGVLQPEIQRIRTAHAGDPATRNATIAALYRSHGVALGSLFFFIVLQWTMVAVLYLLIWGFASLDPSNGGEPSYLEPGSALWQGLQDSGGHLTSFGVDLGSTMLTQGSAVGVIGYTVLLVALVVISAESSRTATKFMAPHGIGILIGALAVALILPVLLFFTSPRLLRSTRESAR
jgi:YidC/Oxa1 family membrane protein insertase